MTKPKRRLIMSQEIVMCSGELWQTVCQMEQFEEHREISVKCTVMPRRLKFMGSLTSGKACAGYYKSLPLCQQRIINSTVNTDMLRVAL